MIPCTVKVSFVKAFSVVQYIHVTWSSIGTNNLVFNFSKMGKRSCNYHVFDNKIHVGLQYHKAIKTTKQNFTKK